MMEEANEVQEALSRSYGTPEIDEDDLEAGKEGGGWFFYIYLTEYKNTVIQYLLPCCNTVIFHFFGQIL